MRKLRIGFIGAGLNAHGHAVALRSIGEGRTLGNDSAEIALVYDLDFQKAAVFAGQHNVAAVAGRAEEILNTPEIDAVYICTPTASHKSYFLKAAAAGKHIFVEKPLAFTTAEIREMISAQAKSKITVQVGLVLRYEPVFWYIKQLIKTERDNIGMPISFYIRSDQEWPLSGSFHDSDWRSNPDQAFAGCLFEHSIHDVDLIRYLFGEVNDLSAFIGYRSPICDRRIEDLATVNFSLDNGLYGNLTTIWHQIKGRDLRRLEVIFERAALILDDYRPWDFDRRYRELSLELSGQPKKIISQEETDQAYYRFINSPELLYPEIVSSYRYQALAFLNALLNRKEATPNLNEALKAHLIIESVYAYAHQNQKLPKLYGQS